MKKIYFILFTLFLHFTVSAQVFWTEDFGSGCNTGTVANGFVSSNGSWVVSQFGTNATYANEWYISGHTSNTGVGNCAANCAGGANNQTLHIGNVAITALGLPAEEGSYLTGFYCGFGYCSETHKRVESPPIDCSGKTAITLDFIYYEGGDLTPGGTNGSADLWYYDGSTWTMLDILAKTTNNCGASSIYGVWNAFSISLPSSADNNPNVKIGFAWDNDDVSVGSDPSAAFDDITLSSSSPSVPVAAFSSGTSTGCDSLCVVFTDSSTGSTSVSWSFPGGTPSTSTDPVVTVCYFTPGSYDVTLVATNANGSDTASQTGYVSVGLTPTPDFSSSSQNLCAGDCIDFTDLSTGSPQTFSWTFSGAVPSASADQNPTGICYNTAGIFTVTLAVQSGICTNTLTRANYINVNQPVIPTVSLMGDTLVSTTAASYQWYNVASGAVPAAIFQFYIVTQTGDYYVCITDGNGCDACSDTIHVDLTGIEDLSSSYSFNIWPNPATEEITLSGKPSNDIRTVSVADITGRIVKTFTVDRLTEKNTFSLRDVEAGNYFVTLVSGNATVVVGRIVKI